MRLIVTEKPSVARDIARVLQATSRGEGYLEGDCLRITWCLGHLVALAEPNVYDPGLKAWRMDRLPMLPEQFQLQPRTEQDRGRANQWQSVNRQLLHPELREVINACDAGREGELIFAYAYQLSGCRAPVRRLWVNALTDEAIRRGFDQLRDGADLSPLEDAARCRSEADWLVGLNATRALTLRNRQNGGSALLSVGRVQTPTLAMICGREREVTQFVSRPFWQVKLRLQTPDGEWEAIWQKGKQNRFDTVDEAQSVLDRVAERPGEVVTAEHKKKKEPAALLYDLTTLQQQANKRFGFSAQQTLDLAQSLYERHKLLTYPRTDSRHLSQAQQEELGGVLRVLDFGPYAETTQRVLASWPPSWSKRLIDDSEVRDHHAIIPTQVSPAECSLSLDEKRIYDLVTRRFLGAFLPHVIFATTRLETKIGEDLFLARGRTRLEPGWQSIDPPFSKKKETTLPAVEVGAIAEQAGSELHEGQTKPPGRYTEAALLGAMERAGEKLEEKELRRAMKGSGLGTPATRAAIIETLLRRGYIFREKKLLRPTERGQALIDALPVEALRSPQLTGRWEARLSAIAEGLETRMEFMRDIRSFTGAVVVDIRQAPAAQPIQGDESSRPQADPLGDCPACGTAVRPRGSVFTCDTGRECPFVVFAETSHAMISEEAVRRLLSTGSSDLIRGFKTRDAQPFDGVLRWNGQRVIPVRIDEREMAGAAGSCPDCGGDVTFRDGRWRCAGCPFTLAAKIMERPIRPTEATSLLENGRTSRLYGFRQKSGAFCKATLILDPEGQVRVDFSKPPGKGPRGLPAGGPLPAFDHPLDCPLCVQRGTLDPGYLVAGKSAWGCSAWKQGCPLQVPFVLSGREMKEEEVLRLLGKHRATKWLRGFKARDGLPRRESCRVLIQLDAECGWTLEEKPRASGR